MIIRVGRIAIAAIATEVLGVATLVLLVALFGPREASAAQPFAERLGEWVGPISGALFCLLGGYWVASGVPTNRVMNGLLLGSAAAVIDVAILVALGSPLRPLFVLSNIGRILFGTLGGWVVSRRRRDDDVV